METIVNVPADVVNTVSTLPRLPNETGTIKVNLKRRLQYKSSALPLNVRPQKVAEAVKWLIRHGNLYKEKGITFNDTWLKGNSVVFMIVHDGFTKYRKKTKCSTCCNKTQQTHDGEDEWSDDEV